MPKPNSIAVLPFANMSAVENDYFSDGITEEIINALAKINGLKVTSRTSAFFFKNKNLPIRHIGKELDVAVILEGSVRLSSAQVRITAQLIQAEDDFHFWSETWDRNLADIFAVQDEVSLLIADKVREHMGHFEISDHLVRKQTQALEAYNLSLKGRFYFNKWNPEDAKKAITCYEAALEIDPNHSESNLGLADCLSFLATIGVMPMEETWGKSIELVHKSIALNNESASGHYQLANIAFFTEADYRKALKHTKRAIQLNPNLVEAIQFHSFFEIIAGNAKAAKEYLQLALQIDPLSPETAFFNGYFHYIIGAFDQGLTIIEEVLAKNSKNVPAHVIKCNCLLKLGKYQEVLSYLDSLPQDLIVDADRTGLEALAFAFLNDTGKAERYLKRLQDLDIVSGDFRAVSYQFIIHAILKNFEKAYDLAVQSIEEKRFMLMLNWSDPLASNIHLDPRFAELKSKIFPPIQETEPSPSTKSLLSPADSEQVKSALLDLFAHNKPYLNPKLSLRSLAEDLEIHPNQLSWLLNEKFGKNFNAFVNHYRVEAFKQNALNPLFEKLTITALAFESGFNSKTAFNTYFKKDTGLTPAQFLKSLN